MTTPGTISRLLKNRHSGNLHGFFFPPEKLARIFLSKEVQPSPESKMIKLLTFENLLPQLKPEVE